MVMNSWGGPRDRRERSCCQFNGTYEPGMLGHEESDMLSFKEWGVDHISVDNCFNPNGTEQSIFEYAHARPPQLYLSRAARAVRALLCATKRRNDVGVPVCPPPAIFSASEVFDAAESPR